VIGMVFSKSFPRTSDKSVYPNWEEIRLTEAEEAEQESIVRNQNIKLMTECINDAKDIVKNTSLKNYQSDLISIGKSLFEKRASHVVYHKEEKAKEKFDEKFQNK
jgi:hypothetical protein